MAAAVVVAEDGHGAFGMYLQLFLALLLHTHPRLLGFSRDTPHTPNHRLYVPRPLCGFKLRELQGVGEMPRWM
jgi:hypothetical protein